MEFANLIINFFLIYLYFKIKYIIRHTKLDFNNNLNNLLNKEKILTKINRRLIEIRNKKEDKSKINKNININSNN